MKRSTPVALLLFTVVIFGVGCDEVEPFAPTTTTELVPGQLDVRFVERVAIAEAETFLQEISLRPLDLSNLEDKTEPNWTIVGVPVGEEAYWEQQLLHYQIVIATRQRSQAVKIE